MLLELNSKAGSGIAAATPRGETSCHPLSGKHDDVVIVDRQEEDAATVVPSFAVLVLSSVTLPSIFPTSPYLIQAFTLLGEKIMMVSIDYNYTSEQSVMVSVLVLHCN